MTARFFDPAAYLLFSTATNEKPVVAARIGAELGRIAPGSRALQLLDAGMGDATVLTEVLRRLHRVFPHAPWLIVGKEISIEDAEASLDKLADRFLEHPEMVFVVTNMSYREAPHLTPLREEAEAELKWTTVPLEGTTAFDFSNCRSGGLYDALVDDWAVRTSPKTGNPIYVRPSVLVLYRKDRVIYPRRCGYRDRARFRAELPADHRLSALPGPHLRRAEDEHGHRPPGQGPRSGWSDGGGPLSRRRPGPGDQGVWPEEEPFQTNRHVLAAAASITSSSRVMRI